MDFRFLQLFNAFAPFFVSTICFVSVILQGSKMSFFVQISMNFVANSRNDKELKYLDESDTKSTVFSGNDGYLRNFQEMSENFNGLFHFPINIFLWSLGASRSAGCAAGSRGGRGGGFLRAAAEQRLLGRGGAAGGPGAGRG